MNKRKHKRRDRLLLFFYSVSGDEDTDASEPDLGSIKDSREGGPEESEELVEGVGEGGCTSILGEEVGFMWTPLPKTFWPCPGQPLGCFL